VTLTFKIPVSFLTYKQIKDFKDKPSHLRLIKLPSFTIVNLELMLFFSFEKEKKLKDLKKKKDKFFLENKNHLDKKKE